jgi:branched-chain amino acid transport system ATP-binding protein
MAFQSTNSTFSLAFEEVTAGYAGAAVVEGLSFSVRQGQRVGLIGRNGAGKTTTLSCAMGLAQLQKGTIRLNGEVADRMPVYARSRAGLGFVPQAREIFPSLTVEENLLAAANGKRGDEVLRKAYTLFPRLLERRKNGGNQLSGGEQQMLAVARAIVSDPKILLLDEPLEGLAPKVREELMGAVEEMVTRTGLGCLLVEQHVDVVLDFVEHVIVLERGLPVFQGSPRELRADPSLLNRFIGLEKV